MIVWLASYPRSGNTLTRILLHKHFGALTYSIHGDEADIAADPGLVDVVGHRELPDASEEGLAKLRAAPEIYYIKTHYLPDARVSEDDKAVYIVRDGRDAISSYRDYIRKFAGQTAGMDELTLGGGYFDLWANHVMRWRQAKLNGFLLLRYEDYLADADTFKSQLFEFLGLNAPDGETPSLEALQGVNRDFFQKGRAARWRDSFSDEDHGLFWLLHGDVMATLDYGEEEDAAPAPMPAAVRTAVLAHVERVAEARAEERAAKLEHELSAARAAEAAARSAEAAAEGRKTQIEADFAALLDRNAETVAAKTRAETERDDLARREGALRDEAAALRASLDAIQGSTVWRATAPIRKLLGAGRS